ncbi:hypothetical protein FQN54_004829 [Arachnomyces sp. PD_36]|nr:hypothetical protein FQN54_004829 [Arachnomyces sp. PD_36]
MSSSSSSIRQTLLDLYHEYTYSSFLVSITCLLLTGLYILSEIFKPPGKKRLASGANPKLPPGPRGVPIFGALLHLKAAQYNRNHDVIRDLAKYGEMTTTHLGAKTWIFLNSSRVASEIISKCGSITNGRSPTPISSGAVSRDSRSLLLPPPKWTEQRRVMHILLSGTVLKKYGEWQELESTQLMAEYLYQPERWFSHHYRYANSVVHRIALGERLVKSSQELQDLQNVVTQFVGSIGTAVIDWFPQLAKLPKFLQPGRKYWDEIGEWHYNVYRSWWLPIRKKIDEGTAPPSFVRDVLLNPDTRFTGNEEEAMYVAMQPVEAGSDTTRQSLNVFVMAMLCYPATFKKAREEVDRVCGGGVDRLPVLADMDQMPYICAMIKEVLRWRPLFPLSPEHMLTSDLEFEGYRFPAGVSFVLNEVPISNEVEDGEEFKPERWLDGHEADVAHGIWGFGGGRRLCVGYRLAQRSLFINIARLVYCYDYSAAGPYDPKVLNHQMTDEPFPVKVTPRSKQHSERIVEDARRLGVLDSAKRSS